MGLIGTSPAIAGRQKRVRLTTPGPAIPDPGGDGGYTHAETPLDPPALWARVTPASARDLERIAGGTTIPTATHLVAIPYHPQITTETILHLEDHPKPDRVLKVVYLGNPGERGADLELICAEQIQ
jgi:head-tail adaptor